MPRLVQCHLWMAPLCRLRQCTWRSKAPRSRHACITVSTLPVPPLPRWCSCPQTPRLPALCGHWAGTYDSEKLPELDCPLPCGLKPECAGIAAEGEVVPGKVNANGKRCTPGGSTCQPSTRRHQVTPNTQSRQAGHGRPAPCAWRSRNPALTCVGGLYSSALMSRTCTTRRPNATHNNHGLSTKGARGPRHPGPGPASIKSTRAVALGEGSGQSTTVSGSLPK